jgi:crossover junction endodeoxyribonuclease RuvC
MISTIIGIDPGLKGALVFFHVEIGKVEIHDMPTVEVVRNGKKKSELSPSALASLLWKVSTLHPHAYLERTGAMPGQGVTSMYSFGRSVGIVEGVLATLQIPVTIVPPQTWQKAVSLRGGKDGSRQRAMELFPAYASEFSRKKDNGRSDAALLAWFGATFSSP